MGGGKGDSRPPNQAAMNAIAGAISGCAARFVVGPLDVLKIRFQVQIEPVSRRAARLAAQQGSTAVLPKYTGMAQALITIAKEEGILVSKPRCRPRSLMFS